MKVRLLLSVLLLLALAAASCSTGPTAPRPGTPAFYWGAAQQTFHSGDFVKTNENLLELNRSDNEFTAKARPWMIVVSAGLTQGYIDMAETYEAGARANRANPTPFRKEVTAMRSLASASALELAEAVHPFLDNKDAAVPLAFGYPSGSALEPGGLKRISSGILVQDSERDSLQAAMLQRGVLLVACRAVGSADDPAKAQETFKAAEPKAARDVFLFALAKLMYEQSDLFGPTKLDQPNRLRLMCQEAARALDAIPPTKDTKALAAKIQAALKKVKAQSL